MPCGDVHDLRPVLIKGTARGIRVQLAGLARRSTPPRDRRRSATTATSPTTRARGPITLSTRRGLQTTSHTFRRRSGPHCASATSASTCTGPLKFSAQTTRGKPWRSSAAPCPSSTLHFYHVAARPPQPLRRQQPSRQQPRCQLPRPPRPHPLLVRARLQHRAKVQMRRILHQRQVSHPRALRLPPRKPLASPTTT